MRHPDAATPPTPGTERRRHHGCPSRQIDAPRITPSDPITQYDLSVHLIAARYGLPSHMAAVIARLAGLGAREAA